MGRGLENTERRASLSVETLIQHQRGLSRHQRGYGTKWDAIRARILKRDNHLCQNCLRDGRAVEARTVDHIIPKAHGGTYRTETQSGDVLIKAHPAAAMKADAWKRIRAMLAEFGMSPASRAKVNIAGPDDVDPLAELLKARD